MQWHIIHDPSDPELDRLAERYHIHPLHIEDCRHRGQSAKIEENGGYIFAVFKPARIVEDGSLEVSDLDVFAGRDFIITVEETQWPCVHEMLARIQPSDRADQLFYRIADAVIDSYLPILDRYDDVVDELEDEVLANPTPDALSRIFETKRSLASLRRILVNTRDVAGHLQRSESHIIERDMWPFLRDVYDHVARNLDSVEVLRDLLNGTLDVYLSSVANRTNQVMKVLTVMSTVALPAIVISGIYGMNVKGLPWIESQHASWIVALLMAGCTALIFFLMRLWRWF